VYRDIYVYEEYAPKRCCLELVVFVIVVEYGVEVRCGSI
jgi:hypothetical protein